MTRGEALLALFVVIVCIIGLVRNRCKHTDDDGASLLVWTWRAGRVRGWCPLCHHIVKNIWFDPSVEFERLRRTAGAAHVTA